MACYGYGTRNVRLGCAQNGISTVLLPYHFTILYKDDELDRSNHTNGNAVCLKACLIEAKQVGV